MISAEYTAWVKGEPASNKLGDVSGGSGCPAARCPVPTNADQQHARLLAPCSLVLLQYIMFTMASLVFIQWITAYVFNRSCW